MRARPPPPTTRRGQIQRRKPIAPTPHVSRTDPNTPGIKNYPSRLDTDLRSAGKPVSQGKEGGGGKREPLPSSWRMGLFSARKCLSRRKRQSLSSVRPDVPRRSNTSYERSGKKAPETRKQVGWEACRGVQNRPRSTGCGWAAGVPHSRCTAIDPTRQ